jgi:hypothetical protein
MTSSKATSFGRLKRKINAKSSYGSGYRKNTNGGEPAKKGMALIRSLYVVQWPFRNMLTSFTTLPVCQCGMEPNPNLGAL